MKAPILLPLVLGISASAIGDELLISQYVEGSSSNKAIEIYNPTDSAVSLTGYTLSIYFNGNTAAGANIELSGSIAAQSTQVIASSSAGDTLKALADVLTSQSMFNGDDAIVLTDSSGNVLDSIGQVGVDPGSSWGSGSVTTANDTLIRLSSVAGGDTDPFDAYDTSEWEGLAQDDFTGLGSHDYTGSGDDGGDDGSGTGGGDEDLSGVCTNCPDLDKVADAGEFDAASYYAAVQAEIDASSDTSVIRQVLSETISGQRVLTYSEVWTALTETDEDPANPDNIILIYSGKSIPKSENGSGEYSSQPDYWNREHSWPKSHGFSSSSNEAYTDIQHLRPSDITVNSSRSNLDFDNSDNALSEAPANRIDSDSFEPRDEVKGDIARMMMYMDMRYEGAGSDVTPDLVLVDRITSNGEAALGKLCTLIAWSNADPVDADETRRHSAIYEYQGNRNPFVDHPEWIDLFYDADSCGDVTAPDPEPDPEPEPEPDPEPQPSGSGALMLTGVFDGPLSGGTPKGIELLVTQNIDDLSVCGVGGANNGGGSDGQEFTFPAVSAVAGQFIYVASEATGFADFFGFAPDYTSGAMSINGDDAIEVFCDGALVDYYGDRDTDGTGTDWDYLDSWAYRTGGSASSTFNIADWQVAGTNVFDGETSNATAAMPFPLGSYVAPATELFFSEYIEGGSDNKAVEIANLTLSDIDLSTYDVQIYFNGSASAGQTFTLTGTLAAGDVFVLAHTSSEDPILNVADMTSGSVQFNGDDAVVLRNNGVIIDSIGVIGEDPGSYWSGGDVRTQNRTLVRKSSVTEGDSDAYDAFDPSVEWDAYAQDTFDYLGFYGTGNDDGGNASLGICGDEATYISAVQGSGDSSPLSGQSVIVEAIVTHVTPALDGFWIQEESSDSDGDETTSEGVFIASASLAGSVTEGEIVRLAGAVGEDYGRTMITASSEALSCGSGSVSAVAITLPMTDASGFEKYEGMLVTSNENWVISNIYPYSDFGEIWVSTERLFNPTQLYAPGSQEAADLATANGLNKLIIDDNADGYASEWMLPAGGFTPYNTIRSGDLITGVTGVMDYGYSAYRIRPVEVPSLLADNYREDAPVVSEGNLKIASFNVLNLFNGDGNEGGFPTERGADSYAEYQRQLAKIVNALVAIDADVLGLLELENDGFGADSTVAHLVDALNAEFGEGTYAYVDAGVEQLGTDAITSGILYRPAVVTPSGAPQILMEANSPSDEEGVLFADYGNRPSLSQLFTHSESGKTFVVDVNHLKSKGSSSSCQEDGNTEQGFCNRKRTRAAMAIAQWLQSTYQDTPMILLGDYNAYAQEDPVQVLAEAGFTDTVSELKGSASYSYTYDGLVGTLDYMFNNAAARDMLVDVTEWHINSDEPEFFDYNEEYKPASFLNELPFRASDHDPVIGTYQLDADVQAVTGDWDGDEDVDNNDIRSFMFAIIARQAIDMAFDLNNDGKVNTRDIAVMRSLCTRSRCATEDAQNNGARRNLGALLRSR